MKTLHFASALGLVMTGAAAQPTNVADSEIALLPPYCADKEWGSRPANPVNQARRAAQLGPSWAGLHHYCWGLVSVRRATMGNLSPAMKRHLIETAVGDYQYTIRHSTPDFVLLPEILLRLGEAYVLLGDPASAISAFEASLAKKPDYWPARLAAADLLVKLRMREQALRTLRDGLALTPDQPNLRSRLAELERRANSDRSSTGSSPRSPSK